MFDWIKRILFKDINDKIKIHIELDNDKYHEEFVDAEKYEDRIQFLQKKH
jgi:hypothetical protein